MLRYYPLCLHTSQEIDYLPPDDVKPVTVLRFLSGGVNHPFAKLYSWENKELHKVFWNQLRPILRFSMLENILSTVLVLWSILFSSVFGEGSSRIFVLANILLVLTSFSIMLLHFDSMLPLATSPSHKPAKLITKGGFRKWIRNPFHFGYLLFILSLAISLNEVLGWLLAGLIVLMNVEITAARDEYLESEFPEAFAEWRKHTWRVLPGIV